MKNKAPIRKPAEDFLTITDLWHLCVSHWHYFVISFTVCFGLACAYLVTTPNLYTRKATLLVKQEVLGKNVGRNASGEDFNDIGLVRQNTNVTNVVRELMSLDVLSRVVRRLGMATDDHDVLLSAQRIQQRLKAQIDDDKSTIVNLTYVALTTAEAEAVLNSLVEVYNEKWIENKNQVTLNTSRFIQDRLSLLERDLELIDDSISNFKERNGITDLNRVSEIYLQQQSQSDVEILKITNQMTMAQYILSMLRDTSSQHQLLPSNSGINNSTAETQISRYNNMLLQLKNSLYGTSGQNPLIMRMESELSDVRNNILTTIENHINTLEIQLRSLQGFSGEARSKILSNPDQAKHLVSVEREQKVKESLYLYLLQKREENEISLTYTSYITEMIDMPYGSDFPTSPNKRNVLFAAILLGLLIPVVILFVGESIDTTVRDRYDIERYTTLSLLGEIPYCNFGEENPNPLKSLYLRLFHREKRSKPNPLIVQPNKQDAVNESFRLMRSNLEFMAAPQGENIYIITSFYMGSGKTFFSMNLALVMALKGKHVLFIDGDLRHASASRYFHCPKLGLADYLAGKETDLNKLIKPYKDYPSLDILPVGTIPPNPTELLADRRLGELLQQMRPLYDYILIDCPPAELLADTGIIERQADRTLFVLRAGLFERKRLDDLIYYATNGKYKHMSLVLNATRFGGRYGYRYGYRYGNYGYHYAYHRNS